MDIDAASAAAMASSASFAGLLNNFWQTQLREIEHGNLDFKTYNLPLARIKKVMKTDDEVKHMMISGEAPIVFAKACEILILELTLRAWLHTDECKRRTLQRNDIATAIARSDIFDFLIDIVPREDGKMKKPDFPAHLAADPAAAASYFYSQHPGVLAAPFHSQLPMDSQSMMYARDAPYGAHSEFDPSTGTVGELAFTDASSASNAAA
jgi:nuclear transcription factor Y, gamma